ncbi:ATP-binding protein, partial [Nonomuraea aridisoli]
MSDDGCGLLGRRLEAARERAFVGREEELAVFRAALCGGCGVVFVHGPGGVGKSALLRRFAREAAVAVKDCGRWTPRQDVVAVLLDQLVGEVPSVAHRRALEVCAHAYVTTEDLLRAVLAEDAGSLFGWLRGLPFVESNGLGLFPLAVVREVVEADLRWRDPEGYAVMRDRVRAYLAERVRTVGDG